MENHTDQWQTGGRSDIQRLRMENTECIESCEKAQEDIVSVLQHQINTVENIFKILEIQEDYNNLTQPEKEVYQAVKRDLLDIKQSILTEWICKPIEDADEEESDLKVFADEPTLLSLKFFVDNLRCTVLRLKAHCEKTENMKAACRDHEDGILKLKAELDRRNYDADISSESDSNDALSDEA